MIFVVTSNSYGQNKVQVDPGVSVHNYKHPNKAQKAKVQANEGTSVQVPSIGTVERVTNARDRRKVRHTPKYANRPAALAVPVSGSSEGTQLNPLKSPRNYKTNAATKPVGTTQGAAVAVVADSAGKLEN
jgi:hypothetical protein